jgi:hypothetical protein
MNAGETQMFTLDERGCLDGGGSIGKYCENDGPAEHAKSASSGGGALSGTWEAKDPDGTVLGLHFLGGDKIKFTMSDGESSDAVDGSCESSGTQVIIGLPAVYRSR